MNKNIWKTIHVTVKASMLTLLLLFQSYLGLSVLADEGPGELLAKNKSRETIQMELFQEGKFPMPEVVLASDELSPKTESDFKNHLYQALLNFEPLISVKQYGLSKNNVRRLMQDLINNKPKLFIVSGECSVEMAGDIVQSVEPVYVPVQTNFMRMMLK